MIRKKAANKAKTTKKKDSKVKAKKKQPEIEVIPPEPKKRRNRDYPKPIPDGKFIQPAVEFDEDEFGEWVPPAELQHSPEKRKGFADRIYNPKTHPDRAFRLALRGDNDAKLAEAFGVTRKTIHRWQELYPVFAQKIEMGRSEADANVAFSLYQQACGYTVKEEVVKWDSKRGEFVKTYINKHIPPNTQATLAWLAKRQKALWGKDSEMVHKITGPDGHSDPHITLNKNVTVDLTKLSMEELKELDRITKKTIDIGGDDETED